MKWAIILSYSICLPGHLPQSTLSPGKDTMPSGPSQPIESDAPDPEESDTAVSEEPDGAVPDEPDWAGGGRG